MVKDKRRFEPICAENPVIDIEFKLNGRKVRPNDNANELERPVFKQVRDNIAYKLKNVRDPHTGAAPKVTVSRRSLDNLSFEVEGSPTLIEEVTRRLK